MKWFWYSLLGFILLMCSCKTQKVGMEVDFSTKENVQTKLSKYQALKDTSNVLRVEIDKSKLMIIETIKITEYDAESGKPIKETEAKRETIQDSNKVSTEEESQVVTNSNELEVNQSIDTNKKVESEVSKESIGGQESFGKYFGIALAVVIGLFLLYLLKKLRIY